MGYPYHFVSLRPEQETRRRELLNSYGQFAQLSILLLPLLYQLGLGFRLLISRLGRGKRYGLVKGHQSPVVAASKQGNRERVGGWARRLRWALDEELIKGWGTTRQWLAAGVWGSWLVLLAVKDTGDGESCFYMFMLEEDSDLCYDLFENTIYFDSKLYCFCFSRKELSMCIASYAPKPIFGFF